MNNNPMAGMMNNMMNGMISKAMQGNPLFQIMSVVKGGGNPMPLIQDIAKTNPKMAQTLKIINGKNPQQLLETANNMCRERGTTVNEVAQSLGFQIPQGK